jgi:hypothetical protein
MLFGETVAVCYESRTEHTYTVCGQKVGLFIAEACALSG